MEVAPVPRRGDQSCKRSRAITHTFGVIHPTRHGTAQIFLVFFRIQDQQHSGIAEVYGLRRGRGRRRVLQAKVQTEPESAALAGRALQTDLAAHQSDQLLTDGSAEPGAAEPPCRGLVGLGKAVENPGLRLMRDAYARVDDFESYGDGIGNRRYSREPHLDAARFGKFDSVTD